MWRLMKGRRLSYIFCFIIQLVSVFFSIVTTYTAKILSDTITLDIFIESRLGRFGTFLTNLYGGPTFLENNLWVFAIIFLVLALIVALLTFLRIFFRSYTSTGFGKNTQMMMFNHIEGLPYSILKKCQSGDIIQTCTRDETVLRRFAIFQTLNVANVIFLIIGSFLAILDLSYQLALVSIAIMLPLFIYSVFLVNEVRKRYRKTDDSEGQMIAKIEENLSAVRIVKAYNNERYEMDDFERYIDDYQTKFKRWRIMSSLYFSTSDILVFGQIALSTIFGLFFVIENIISIGTFIVTNSFVTMIVWPLRDMANIFADFARAIVAVDRINLIINEDIEDIKSGETPAIKGDIVFDDVSFKYEDGEESVLNHLSFSIKSGQTIAIMGKTGSGKSTIAQLLTRLYDVSGGVISIDGVNINNIQKTYLRKNVCCVLQESFLFSRTIENNIRMADKSKDLEEVQNVAKIADVHDSIMSFEKDYQTPVGENGVTLSGGQKQRIAMARSLLTNPPIIIFDDSFSAVDTETDIRIREALKRYKNNTTIIIITHRVATAFEADKILVLDDGKISQSGTHEELLKEEGLYKKLYDIQTRMV